MMLEHKDNACAQLSADIIQLDDRELPLLSSAQQPSVSAHGMCKFDLAWPFLLHATASQIPMRHCAQHKHES